MLHRFSLLYVQTLFYFTLLTLSLLTACLLLRFVNGLINGSSSSIKRRCKCFATILVVQA